MAKLTLSVEDRVVERAKRYAKRHGVSVSSLVQEYLDSITQPVAVDRETPVLKELRSLLSGAREADYYRHLEDKYFK
jgi:hypothetical protein